MSTNQPPLPRNIKRQRTSSSKGDGDSTNNNVRNNFAWKRARDLPDFLDASATVSASTFGARRLPEIKALWSARIVNNKTTTTTSSTSETNDNNSNNNNSITRRIIPSEQALQSSGGKTSSRHLRRRATSHKSRKRHRYPTNNGPTTTFDNEVGTDETSKSQPEHQDAIQPITPSSRRAQRKNKTILAVAHESWWRERPQQEVKPEQPSEATLLIRINAKENDLDTTKAPNDTTITATVTTKTDAITMGKYDHKNKAVTNPTTTSSVNWMTTHVWHAKRFHMAELWGWQIPMVHTNRGPKAALRLIREGKTLVQDVTWKMARPIVLIVQEKTTKMEGSTMMQQLQTCMQCLVPEFQIRGSNTTPTTMDKHMIQSGQGMMYALDRFPRNALGPVTWLFSGERPLMTASSAISNVGTTKVAPGDDGSTRLSDCSFLYLYFWVHPAIQSTVWKQFESLREACDANQHSYFRLKLQHGFLAQQENAAGVGMSCLQLRGMNSTKAIQALLCFEKSTTSAAANANAASSPNSFTSRTIASADLLEDPQLHKNVPPGTPISAWIKLDHGAVSIGTSCGNTLDKKDEEILSASETPWIQGHRVMLISRFWGDPDNPQNAPAIGWDICCDAAVSKILFGTLVLASQACPIGLVEEAFLNLECQPPRATIFPRDYPETEEGHKYWFMRGDCNIESDDAKSSSDLSILRLCLELGEAGGRVPVPLIKQRCKVQNSSNKADRLDTKISTKHLCKIDWNGLVSDNQHNDETNVVMMRGMFGKPLLDALSGSGKVPNQPPSEDDGKPRRAKRRKVKQHNEIHHVIPLSREEAEASLLTCNTLLQALSLPAVIACHLKAAGLGTFKPGAQIYAVKGKNIAHHLGFVTASSFSVGRGRYHGIGVVGASHLLRALILSSSSVQYSHDALALVEDQGVKQIHLVVNVQCGAGKFVRATLGLLL